MGKHRVVSVGSKRFRQTTFAAASIAVALVAWIQTYIFPARAEVPTGQETPITVTVVNLSTLNEFSLTLGSATANTPIPGPTFTPNPGDPSSYGDPIVTLAPSADSTFVTITIICQTPFGPITTDFAVPANETALPLLSLAATQSPSLYLPTCNDILADLSANAASLAGTAVATPTSTLTATPSPTGSQTVSVTETPTATHTVMVVATRTIVPATATTAVPPTITARPAPTSTTPPLPTHTTAPPPTRTTAPTNTSVPPDTITSTPSPTNTSVPPTATDVPTETPTPTPTSTPTENSGPCEDLGIETLWLERTGGSDGVEDGTIHVTMLSGTSWQLSLHEVATAALWTSEVRTALTCMARMQSIGTLIAANCLCNGANCPSDSCGCGKLCRRDGAKCGGGKAEDELGDLIDYLPAAALLPLTNQKVRSGLAAIVTTVGKPALVIAKPALIAGKFSAKLALRVLGSVPVMVALEVLDGSKTSSYADFNCGSYVDNYNSTVLPQIMNLYVMHRRLVCPKDGDEGDDATRAEASALACQKLAELTASAGKGILKVWPYCGDRKWELCQALSVNESFRCPVDKKMCRDLSATGTARKAVEREIMSTRLDAISAKYEKNCKFPTWLKASDCKDLSDTMTEQVVKMSQRAIELKKANPDRCHRAIIEDKEIYDTFSEYMNLRMIWLRGCRMEGTLKEDNKVHRSDFEPAQCGGGMSALSDFKKISKYEDLKVGNSVEELARIGCG